MVGSSAAVLSSPSSRSAQRRRFTITSSAATDSSTSSSVRRLSEGSLRLSPPRAADESNDASSAATATESVARPSGTSSSLESRPRNSVIDFGLPSGPRLAIAKSAIIQKVRPVLRASSRLTSHSSPSAPSTANPRPPSSGPGCRALTPTPAASDGSHVYWKPLPPAGSSPPVLPEPAPPRESDDFSKVLEEVAATSPSRPPTPPPKELAAAPESRSRPKSRHRSISQRTMLASALQKAHMAVTLDNAENYEGAMEAYEDACVLLTEVMDQAGPGEDKIKLQTIRNTYMERINEIRALPAPIYRQFERRLPPRPAAEESTDEASLYTVGTDESTHVPAQSLHADYDAKAKAVPPRRDSLYVGPDNRLEDSHAPPPLPVSHLVSSEDVVPAPLSPRPPPPVIDALEPESMPEPETAAPTNQDPFTHAFSGSPPRHPEDVEGDHHLDQTPSDLSSRLYVRKHSRRRSGEGTTSWLNTIDESSSSLGESSPVWTRLVQDTSEPIEEEANFDDDFDTQLDAAVEAAYDDGYEVDYTFDSVAINQELDKDEELLMIQSPRLNVERAKERVRQVEREMEVEIQKERERKMERERMGFFKPPKGNSELDFYNEVDDDESEEERMLEEMTRGYTLDFDFNLDTKTALPRESSSTQYSESDTTLPRGSMSSGYSSGTTWTSSVSGHSHITSTSLTTVAEAPSTPPLPPSIPSNVARNSGSPKSLKSRSVHSSPAKPPPPPPISAITPVLPASKPTSVRSRRLSGKGLEPLKIETLNVSSSSEVSQHATVAQSSPPLSTPHRVPPPPPAPLDLESRSSRDTTGSRPETSHGPDADNESLLMMAAKPTSSTGPEPPSEGPSSVPLQKTLSDDGSANTARSGSPALLSYTPKIPDVPPLRQIHSSASLRSRNFAGLDMETHGSSLGGLFSSSSTSNLRKGLAQSVAPGTPIVPMTPIYPPPTAGLPSGGMNLFDSKLHSPEMQSRETDSFESTGPAPLEPCPPLPLSKPFWLMRCLYQTIAHAHGGYISTRLFVPREVWYIRGVKLKAVDDKICACDLVTAALQKLAAIKQDQINSVFEEMQALEGVLDRAQNVLQKKLGSEVGAPGAKALYGEGTPSERNDNMVTTKVGSVGSGGKYFSLRKLRTKASNSALGSGAGAAVPSGDSYTGLPMAGAGAEAQQAKRNIDTASFGGPNANYIAALAKLFDAAQVLDRLPVFNGQALPQKLPIKLRIELEISQRHAAEFFGFYICRFVLHDISLLLDKFVKRGSEWVSQ